MKRLVLCLDGTWNNTYARGRREDGGQVIKPSNVLKLARAVLPRTADGVEQNVLYHSGVGAMSHFPGLSNRVLGAVDKYLGGTWGAGFESNLEDALTYLVNNCSSGRGAKGSDEVYVFGFSRGAATARALTQLLDWMGGLPHKRDAYYLPLFIRAYIDSRGQRSAADVRAEIVASVERENARRTRNKRLIPLQKMNRVQVRFLGVWDTVLSLGSRLLPWRQRRFLLRDEPARCVQHARQALAIDERRHDFYPALWRAPGHTEQSLKQCWFAGVHANIGGGYVRDGLANGAFQWMLRQLREAGCALALDATFCRHYRPYAQDVLEKSDGLGYRLKDFIARKNGVRPLCLEPEGAFAGGGFSIDFSVFQRLLSDPAEHPRLRAYAPENLLRCIDSVGIEAALKGTREWAEAVIARLHPRERSTLNAEEKSDLALARRRLRQMRQVRAHFKADPS